MKVPLTFLATSVRAELTDAQNALHRATWRAKHGLNETAGVEMERATLHLKRIELLIEQIEQQHAAAVA